MTEHYCVDYPKKAIGKGNPYYRCAFCGVSDPEINGQIENHRPWCKYRILKTTQGKDDK